MKNTKWLFLTLAIVSFPVMHTHADVNTTAKEVSATEQGEIASKNEVIYANLQAGGSLQDIYVVNALEVNKQGILEDFGDYEKIKNLTDTSSVQQKDDKVLLHANTNMYYYQGDLSKETPLPWSFSIAYYLDDEKITPNDLIGQSGSVKIKVSVKENKDSNQAFFENYMLQISLPLNTDYFTNIDAEDATIANSGKNKQLAFTVMPGEEKTFTIVADAKDFEMDGFQIAALPSSMPIDSPDTDELTGEFDTLTDAVGEINNGVGELATGMNDFSNGLSELENGSSQYKDGLNELNQSSSDLTNASSQINSALSSIQKELKAASGVSGLEGLTELGENMPALADGLGEIANGMDQFAAQYQSALNGLDSAIQAIPVTNISEADIAALQESNADQEVVQELMANYQAAQTIKGTYEQTSEAFHSVEPSLAAFSQSTNEVASQIRKIATGLEASMGDSEMGEGLNQLIIGLEQMSSNYQQFHEGLVGYTEGVSALSQSYDGLHSGIAESAKGANELTTGMNELHNGTTQLYDATASIPDEMQKEIDSMINQYDKSDFEPVSFVSEKNDEKTDSVQFVISTESLQPDEEETEQVETKEKLGFWEKLKNLFK